MSPKNSQKKIVPVLLHPNSIEDTPFKELPQLASRIFEDILKLEKDLP